GLPVDREVRGEPHAAVVPRRLRVPLLGEVEPVRRRIDGPQAEPGCAPDLVAQLADHREGDVRLAAPAAWTDPGSCAARAASRSGSCANNPRTPPAPARSPA